MQSPDIENVKLLQEYTLLLTFTNGERKIFDMSPYINYSIFKPLTNKEEFKAFSIVDGTIEWKCGAELSNDTFYIGSSEYKSNVELKEM